LRQASQPVVSREGAVGRRREGAPAAARARAEAGRAGPVVIAFGDGLLDPARWRVIENCVCASSVPSTNALARELIALYFEEGLDLGTTALIAEEQPGAYGRSGRAWRAPAGMGLYLTIVRSMPAEDPLSVVPIAVARWTSEVLREQTG